MSIMISLLLLQSAAGVPATAQVEESPSDDAKIVCKTVNTTGSRLGGKRVCASKKEWRRLNDEAEKTAREVQDTFSKQTPDS
jgi:hypothetical protein